MKRVVVLLELLIDTPTNRTLTALTHPTHSLQLTTPGQATSLHRTALEDHHLPSPFLFSRFKPARICLDSLLTIERLPTYVIPTYPSLGRS